LVVRRSVLQDGIQSVDKLLLDQFEESWVADGELSDQAHNNTIDNFRLVFDRKLRLVRSGGRRAPQGPGLRRRRAAHRPRLTAVFSLQAGGCSSPGILADELNASPLAFGRSLGFRSRV
jgi:hypothetical protein